MISTWGAVKSLASQVRDIFNKYGTDAHLYLPGVGIINGFTAGNYLDSAGTTAASVDGLVGLVKDAANVSGINASQATTGAKPTLRKGIVNLLLGSSSPIVRIVTPSAAPYTLAMIGTGAVTVSGGYIGVLNGTSASDITVINFTPTEIATTFTPSGSVTSFGLFQGTLTASQILAAGGIPLTTTAAASSSLGPQYLQFDGVDDRLNLGAIPWQSSDDWCVVSAVSRQAGTGESAMFSVYGSPSLLPDVVFGSDGLIKAYARNDAGTLVQCTGSAYAIGAIKIVTVRVVSGVMYLRVNGVDVAQATIPSGAYTLTASSIGALGVGGYLAANSYATIPLKGTLTLAEVQLLENQAAALAGGRLVGGNFVSNY